MALLTSRHDITNALNSLLGSGIKADHSEFENRAKNGFSSSGDSTDCEGSGKVLKCRLVSARFSFIITFLGVET